MKRKNLKGSVKVTNALTTIHNIFNEIAPQGTLNCQTHNTCNESTFVFMANGICATLHIQAFTPQPIAKGGRR